MVLILYGGMVISSSTIELNTTYYKALGKAVLNKYLLLSFIYNPSNPFGIRFAFPFNRTHHSPILERKFNYSHIVHYNRLLKTL